MCGGGGVPAPDPWAEAQAQILIMQEQARIDAEQELARLEREAAEREQERADFLSSLDSATAAALMAGEEQIAALGYDPALYQPQLQTQVNQLARTVPFLDPNPQLYFGDDIGQAVLDAARTQQSNQFNQQLLQFASPGFEFDLIPRTADDAILEAILSQQFGTASEQLQRAADRGQLTPLGFETALAQLPSQEAAARALLQDIGGGVLETGRQELRDIAGRGFDTAGAFQLGQTFDPSSIESAILGASTEFGSNLEGRLQNAIGDMDLFNFERLMAQGGRAQGTQNTGFGGEIADAIAQRERERGQTRGVGNVGVF